MEKKFCRQFAEHQQIQTERLLLRPITLADAADLYQYACDLENTKFVFPVHKSIEETKDVIAQLFMKEPLGRYGIEYIPEKKLIGTIELRIDESGSVGELGYALNKLYWGHNFAGEASEALLYLGFHYMGLVRIIALHDDRNLNSGRVMEKLGMKIESTVPEAKINLGEVVGMVQRSITSTQYQAQRKKSLL